MNIPNQPKIKIRIQIETPCDECDGSGKIEAPDPDSFTTQELECSSCLGEGWQTSYISLDELKEILDSGE